MPTGPVYCLLNWLIGTSVWKEKVFKTRKDNLRHLIEEKGTIVHLIVGGMSS